MGGKFREAQLHIQRRSEISPVGSELKDFLYLRVELP
jgi:hypothetical protein